MVMNYIKILYKDISGIERTKVVSESELTVLADTLQDLNIPYILRSCNYNGEEEGYVIAVSPQNVYR